MQRMGNHAEITGGEKMTIHEMQVALGYTRKKFSERYEIPVRTLEDWEAGKRKPAPYILKLLERAVLQDLKEMEEEKTEEEL